MTRLRLCLVLATVLCAACSPQPEAQAPASGTARAATKPAQDPEFWRVWGDGQAELNGYDLTYPRYGQLRKGVAIAIFVTETFSNSARVKADPGRHAAADQFPVMKLNLIKDFQTGIYDYNDMTSVFLALAPVNGRPAGSPTKVSFSRQEWCGHVFLQAIFSGNHAELVQHSYFDGEADHSQRLSENEPWTSEDALMLWARGMAQPRLKPGKSAPFQVMTSLETVRSKHIPPTIQEAQLLLASRPKSITVPAGTFETDVFTAKLPGGFSRTYYVERAMPKRVIRWETSEGERADLLASDRMQYWKMNREGGEEALKRLGLTRRGPRMP